MWRAPRRVAPSAAWCLVRGCAATTPPPPPLSLGRLPLDVVLRRLQSASLVNRARGLLAHFADVAPPVCGAGGVAARRRGLQAALGARLRDALRGDGAARDDVELVSLIAANAVRHGLGAALRCDAIVRLAEALHGGGGGNSAACRVEALARVLEACVDVAGECGASRAAVLSVSEWAALLGALEDVWRGGRDDGGGADNAVRAPLAMLAVQCCAVALAAGDDGGDEGRATTGGVLRADARLVRERAHVCCARALVVVVSRCASPAAAACSASDLVLLCDALRRVAQYERASLAAGGAALVSCNGPRRARLPWRRGAAAASPNGALATRLCACVVSQVRARAAAARHGDAAVTALALPQLARVFDTLVDLADGDVIADVSLLVCDELRRYNDGGRAVDAGVLRDVLLAGEACARAGVGTRAVLAGVLRCVRNTAVALLSCVDKCDGDDDGAKLACATNGLWWRACRLLARVPATMRDEQRCTTLALVRALLCTDVDKLLASCAASECDARELRDGALLLIDVLLRDGDGHVSARLFQRVAQLVRALPLRVDEGAANMARALDMCASMLRNSADATAQRRDAAFRDVCELVVHMTQDWLAQQQTEAQMPQTREQLRLRRSAQVLHKQIVHTSTTNDRRGEDNKRLAMTALARMTMFVTVEQQHTNEH